MKNIERSFVCGGRRPLLHSNASKFYPFLNVFMNIKILRLNYATRPNRVSDCRLEISGEVWFLHNLSDAVLLQSFFPFIAAWFAAWEPLPSSFVWKICFWIWEGICHHCVRKPPLSHTPSCSLLFIQFLYPFCALGGIEIDSVPVVLHHQQNWLLNSVYTCAQSRKMPVWFCLLVDVVHHLRIFWQSWI